MLYHASVISRISHLYRKKEAILLIIVDRRSRVPAYEQIKNEIMTLISIGSFKAHEKLPSIRAVAVETGINVNTVKKAFAELEANGVIYSVPGMGSFVNENALHNGNLRAEAFRDISQAVSAAISKGITKEDVINLINDLYKGDD